MSGSDSKGGGSIPHPLLHLRVPEVDVEAQGLGDSGREPSGDQEMLGG